MQRLWMCRPAALKGPHVNQAISINNAQFLEGEKKLKKKFRAGNCTGGVLVLTLGKCKAPHKLQDFLLNSSSFSSPFKPKLQFFAVSWVVVLGGKCCNFFFFLV